MSAWQNYDNFASKKQKKKKEKEIFVKFFAAGILFDVLTSVSKSSAATAWQTENHIKNKRNCF